MTLNEWIEQYNSKTPEKFERDTRYELFFNPERGFCEVGEMEGMIVINQLCGDARYFKDKVDDAARASGIKIGGTWCIRKEIKAYIRLFGYKIIETYKLSDGNERYVCVHKKTGKGARVSPSFYYKDSKIQAYFITWQI